MNNNNNFSGIQVKERQSYSGILLYTFGVTLWIIPGIFFIFFYLFEEVDLFYRLINQYFVFYLIIIPVLSLIIPHKPIDFTLKALIKSFIHTFLFILALPILIIMYLGLHYILFTMEDFLFRNATKDSYVNLLLSIFSLYLSLVYWAYNICKLWELIYGTDSSQFLKIKRSNIEKEKNGLLHTKRCVTKKDKDPYLLSSKTVESLIQEYNRKNL